MKLFWGLSDINILEFFKFSLECKVFIQFVEMGEMEGVIYDFKYFEFEVIQVCFFLFIIVCKRGWGVERGMGIWWEFIFFFQELILCVN